MDDDEIIACVAKALGLPARGATVTPLSGKQGLIVCRVCLSAAENIIFKAVRESGRTELRLSQLLWSVAPYAVTEVLHVAEDDRRGYYWLAMRDEGDTRLEAAPTRAAYARVASTLARLQIDVLPRLTEVQELGLRTVTGQDWEEAALAVLQETDGGALASVSDPDALTGALWRVGEVAAQASGLPMTIVHGDLHAGNIAVRSSGDVRLLDWGSAYVGAAFLGLSELLWPAERYSRQIGDFGAPRKAYLDHWAPLVGKPGRLVGAIAACDALARLSVLQEAIRRPDRFGPFGAATLSHRFVEAIRHWERERAC